MHIQQRLSPEHAIRESGSNVLGASKDPRLLPIVLGVAAIYPMVDVGEDGAVKMATRPDPTIPDFIGGSFADLIRIDLDSNQMPAVTGVRISPGLFADRKSLPSQALLIGAEHDMFCHEDEAMANGGKVDSISGWRAPGVEWYKVMGQSHAFDAFATKAPESEAARLAAVDAMYAVLSQWLLRICTESSR